MFNTMGAEFWCQLAQGDEPVDIGGGGGGVQMTSTLRRGDMDDRTELVGDELSKNIIVY